mgnify:FL=1
MTLGNRIKQARKKAGITQKELARKLNIAEITVRQYENDKRQPRLEFLENIADALNVDVWNLYNYYKLSSDPFLQKMDQLRSELNEKGQEKAIEQVNLLTRIPEYQSND